ncbi:MAG: AmmeMemoRadiSam system protein B [Cellvibrionaceae bacterium]
MKIRQPAVAGLFYPQDSEELQHQVNSFLQEAILRQPSNNDEQPQPLKALIAPHAGYIYSGAIAASAYSLLVNNHCFSRVLLLGPSHRVGFRGIATPDADTFHTPLGNIPLDTSALRDLESLPFVHRREDAHLAEHSLEVQLPFLQEIIKDFVLVPLVVGDAASEQVEEVLKQQWLPDTLVVISTDLSHFLNYQDATETDKATSIAITEKSFQLQGEQACGCRPLNGLLKYCANKGLEVSELDLRNSGDTAGDKARVVGYGAYAVY